MHRARRIERAPSNKEPSLELWLFSSFCLRGILSACIHLSFGLLWSLSQEIWEGKKIAKLLLYESLFEYCFSYVAHLLLFNFLNLLISVFSYFLLVAIRGSGRVNILPS